MNMTKTKKQRGRELILNGERTRRVGNVFVYMS